MFHGERTEPDYTTEGLDKSHVTEPGWQTGSWWKCWMMGNDGGDTPRV